MPIVHPTRRELISASMALLAGTTTARFGYTNIIKASSAGTVGNGVADDSRALAKLLSECPEGGLIDLEGRQYLLSAPLRIERPRICVANGSLRLVPKDLSPVYAITAADDCLFDSLSVLGPGITGSAKAPRYIGGIFSGNGDYPGVMNRRPADRVFIRNCSFARLTAGIFVGGATGQSVPRQWRIENCRFQDMVGFPGQSEGYGVLLSPGADSVVIGNHFSRISRHSIYLAANTTRNLVDSNIIEDCGNIAIHINTIAGQDHSHDNRIIGNQISSVYKMKELKYESAVAIGFSGRFLDSTILNNRISQVEEAGIMCSASDDNLSGTGIQIAGNTIDVPPEATDCAIRCERIASGRITENAMQLRGPVYGIAVWDPLEALARRLVIDHNRIDVHSSEAVPFRFVTNVEKIQMLTNTITGLAEGASRVITTLN